MEVIGFQDHVHVLSPAWNRTELSSLFEGLFDHHFFAIMKRGKALNPGRYVANRSLNRNIVVIAMRMPMVVTTMPTSSQGQISQLAKS